MQLYVKKTAGKSAIALEVIATGAMDVWQKKQAKPTLAWLNASHFEGKPGKFALLPDVKTGALTRVVAVVDDISNLWSLAHLPAALPEGEYVLQCKKTMNIAEFALGWQLATYQFNRFKEKSDRRFPTLIVPDSVKLKTIQTHAEAVFLVRDLINRPANDLTPLALAQAAESLAKQHKARCKVICGDALLAAHYPLVHAVGRASANLPCLVDLQWGKKTAPKLTLVGKGVCFDSGGLDIKPSSGMKLMKKDMGGAAHVLGLAHLIMSANLNVCLRVLIPAVENSISSNAFRTSDVIRSRKGLSVEIGNTDAEGRLILSDALTEADSEKPDLLIDFATLTGAARVALGTEIPAFFTPDDALAEAIVKASQNTLDPLWRLPLWAGYREQLDSSVADINSAPDGGYGGAITAALYLKEFVEHTSSWVHIDLMAWNVRARAGRPQGGEAMGLRAIFAMINEKFP